eukprot:206876-Prymnesium_polylepis.1
MRRTDNAAHYAHGWHPSTCRRGNVRMRGPCGMMRYSGRSFGCCGGCGETAAVAAEAGRALHADTVAYHWRSPGRHLWVDVAVTQHAVTTPDTSDALAAGSRDVPGTAARLRERKKHCKYGATVDRVGGAFGLQ